MSKPKSRRGVANSQKAAEVIHAYDPIREQMLDSVVATSQSKSDAGSGPGKNNAEYLGEKYYCPYCDPIRDLAPGVLEPHWTVHRKQHISQTPPKEGDLRAAAEWLKDFHKRWAGHETPSHTHQYVIPVETDYKYAKDAPGTLVRTVVKVLRCSCGEEITR